MSIFNRHRVCNLAKTITFFALISFLSGCTPQVINENNDYIRLNNVFVRTRIVPSNFDEGFAGQTYLSVKTPHEEHEYEIDDEFTTTYAFLLQTHEIELTGYDGVPDENEKMVSITTNHPIRAKDIHLFQFFSERPTTFGILYGSAGASSGSGQIMLLVDTETGHCHEILIDNMHTPLWLDNETPPSYATTRGVHLWGPAVAVGYAPRISGVYVFKENSYQRDLEKEQALCKVKFLETNISPEDIKHMDAMYRPTHKIAVRFLDYAYYGYKSGNQKAVDAMLSQVSEDLRQEVLNIVRHAVNAPAVDDVPDAIYNDLKAGRFADVLPVLIKLHDAGNTQATTLLGKMYGNGDGVKKSRDKARDYFRQASSNGNHEATFSLAISYRSEDLATYARYCEIAASNGHLIAAQQIGLAYYKGDGVKQDDIQAYKWLFSIQIRTPVAVETWTEPLAELNRRMTGEDVELGMVAAWNLVYVDLKAGWFQNVFDRDNPSFKGRITPGNYTIEDGGRLVIKKRR